MNTNASSAAVYLGTDIDQTVRIIIYLKYKVILIEQKEF